MLTSLPLKAALSAASILLIPETAFSIPITAIAKYPVVPNSDTNELVCYMQTADGRTLNLDTLCSKKLATQSQIMISEVSYDGSRLIGRVINKNDKAVYLIKVNYEVLGKDGSVIERGATPTEPQMLKPGQTATFQTFVSGSGNYVRTTSVEWDE